jgi:hypothetical protein
MPSHDTPASLLDSHLILNGLGRVSARYYAAARQECAEIFAVSDYLALGLRLMAQGTASCAQEAELLEAYLALHASCKYARLQTHIRSLTDSPAGQLAPHMVCDMARCLIDWLRPEATQDWELHAELDTLRVEVQVCSVHPSPLPLAVLQSALEQLSAGLKQQGWEIGLTADVSPKTYLQARIVARLCLG